MPLRANSYMDFCCDGNVTQDVTATYGNIAKVVCAAESQQSAFDFISVDCDLCGSGEVSFWQGKSRVLMPTVTWTFAVMAT